MDFLSNVSHEFRTPVNTICGISEIILQEDISDTARENILNIQTAGRNLLSMIGDVVDFSNLESGKMTLIEEPYHLTSTINDIINMALAYKGSKDLELIVDFDAKTPHTLLGDEQQLRRVILNLVNNAVKFTETGCITIVISARPEEYGVNLCVKVKDTGIGIAEEHLETLFTDFHQVDTRRNRQQGGIGIGLAISKKIITKMNGFISAKSELGKGSEFQFVVPQKVVDSRPIVTVRNAESMHILFYVNTEKVSFTQIRDHYMSSICHMLEGLEVRYHLCRNLGELKRRTDREIYTHALITQDEYLEDPGYFDALSRHLKIIMIQDRETTFVPGGTIQLIHKPFYVLSFAAVLNDDDAVQTMEAGLWDVHRKFTAPEASVLVVDDNLMNLKVVEGLLRPYRIKVVAASGGEECLEKLEKLRCDIIFMDHMMPGMDGVETAHRIRKKAGAYFQNVPIIALTANAIDGAREMFLEEGFQEYISKPIEITYMEKVLRKYLPADKLLWAEAPERSARTQTPALPPQKTPLIDRSKGIKHLGGSAEAYREVLQVYLDEGQEVLADLEKRYVAKDWKNYTIYVHALKSNSFGIGADRLGEVAKALEAAGKEGNALYIEAHHDEMMVLYREVLSEIGGTPHEAPPEQGFDDRLTGEAVPAEASNSLAQGRDPV